MNHKEKQIMSNQMFDIGDTISDKSDTKLECVAVTYREDNGEREKFAYTFRDQAEVEKERVESEPETAVNTEGETDGN